MKFSSREKCISSCFSPLVCVFDFPLCFHFSLPRDRAFFTRLAPCSKKKILFRNSGRYVWESWSHHEFFYPSRSRHSLASREDSTFQLTCFPNQDSGATARLLNRLDLDHPEPHLNLWLWRLGLSLDHDSKINAWIALPGRVEPFNSASYVVVASSSFPDREAWAINSPIQIEAPIALPLALPPYYGWISSIRNFTIPKKKAFLLLAPPLGRLKCNSRLSKPEMRCKKKEGPGKA